MLTGYPPFYTRDINILLKRIKSGKLLYLFRINNYSKRFIIGGKRSFELNFKTVCFRENKYRIN